MKDKGKIVSFTDLIAWQKGHKIVLEIYKVTASFPESEKFGLTGQMRRAAVSITSNVAEGFTRQSYREKVQFYSIANASLTELQNQLMIARDINYIKTRDFTQLEEATIEVHKIINALIKSSRKRALNP